MRSKWRLVAGLLLAFALAAVSFRDEMRALSSYLFSFIRTRASVEDRVAQYGAEARALMAPYFAEASVSYPPKYVVLLGLKREKVLEIYAGEREQLKFIHRFPVLAASGISGPKLREGDLQVPEGIYPITALNPNSQFHLSLRVGYPNDFDRAKAVEDGRTALGGDIMIHGNRVSIGCLAIGDEAIEQLFVLAADVGVRNMKVILSPLDPRVHPMPGGEAFDSVPAWTPELYEGIREEIFGLLRHQRSR